MFNTKILKKISYLDIQGEIPAINTSVSTDSRTIEKNGIYIPLIGPRFDGHDFILDAIKNGALVVFVQKNRIENLNLYRKNNSHVCFVVVKDTLHSLQELAILRRKEWKSLGEQKVNRTLIGITGSNGKTTHKEMLKFLGEKIFPGTVHATAGNLNNHIGVPLTLLSLCDHHKLAIVELGANHMGEIKLLSDILSPDAGLITNIGLAHIEFFKDRETVYQEKTALYQKIKKNKGITVISCDDEMLMRMACDEGVISYGENADTNNQSNKIIRTDYGLILKERNEDEMILNNPNILEWYNLKNIVGCYLLLKNIFPEKTSELRAACCELTLPHNNRSEWILGANETKIFLDAYNANPSSMMVSLNSFLEILSKEKISMNQVLFVLGDMNELGARSYELHYEIGKFLAEKDSIHMYFVGNHGEAYKNGANGGVVFRDSKEAIGRFTEDVASSQFKYIFVKGSRSLQLESLIDITNK